MSQELQYIFSLEGQSSFREDDYIVSSCNVEAYKWIKQWPHWGESSFNHFTFLSGEAFSGKSHLASIWGKYSDAIVIDENFVLAKKYLTHKSNYIFELKDCTPELEVALFHFINSIIEAGNFLLVISQLPQSHLKFSLKDLESRLKAFPSITIKDPDDKLVEQVIVKYFSDHQVTITLEALRFLKTRTERSYQNLFTILEILNKESLSQKKKISIGFIKHILKI